MVIRKKIGALDNSQRGVWSITQTGLDFLQMDNAEAALRRARKAGSRETRKIPAEQQVETVEGDEELTESDNDGGEHWKGELLGVLKSMEPSAFERLSMRLVKEAGFRNVEVLGKSGDGGIDGVGVYKVSLVSFPTYFQCKRSNGTTPIGCRSSFRKLLIQRSFSCDLGRCLSQAEAEFPGLAMQMFDLPNPAFFLEALDPSFDERLTARQHQVDHARQLVCGCFDRAGPRGLDRDRDLISGIF